VRLGQAVSRPVCAAALRRLHGRIAVSQEAQEIVARFFPGDYHITLNDVNIHCVQPSAAPLPQRRIESRAHGSGSWHGFQRTGNMLR
jgi:hypothetical protein